MSDCWNCLRNYDGGCPYSRRERPENCEYFDAIKKDDKDEKEFPL